MSGTMPSNVCMATIPKGRQQPSCRVKSQAGFGKSSDLLSVFSTSWQARMPPASTSSSMSGIYHLSKNAETEHGEMCDMEEGWSQNSDPAVKPWVQHQGLTVIPWAVATDPDFGETWRRRSRRSGIFRCEDGLISRWFALLFWLVVWIIFFSFSWE